MGTKKDLEDTIKEKVNPLLEEVMEKSWGVTIPKIESDITDKLVHQQLDIYIPIDFNFSQAKKKFKKEFLKRELRFHLGNVSQLAKFLGIDRRSVHRVIKELNINIDELREQEQTREKYYEGLIDKKIKSTLDQYRGIIQPQKMEKMYQELPTLSRNIAKFIPPQHLTWKEAEKEFEKQFLLKSLEEGKWNVAKTAVKIKIRAETLHRKIKKLGLKKG